MALRPTYKKMLSLRFAAEVDIQALLKYAIHSSWYDVQAEEAMAHYSIWASLWLDGALQNLAQISIV